MHSSHATCLALGEDQLILSGSAYGGVAVSGLVSDQRVATLKCANLRGSGFFSLFMQIAAINYRIY